MDEIPLQQLIERCGAVMVLASVCMQPAILSTRCVLVKAFDVATVAIASCTRSD